MLNQECQLLSSTTLLPGYDQSKPPAKFCCSYRHLLIRSFYNRACKILSKQLPVFQRQKSIASIASKGQPESSRIHDRTQDKGKAFLRIILRVQIVILVECLSYSGKSGRFLNYLNLWAYLEYLFIYQGDTISNFHHVNQMPPVSHTHKKIF